MALPRIITVDPLGNIPNEVRGAISLLDRLAVQIDLPSAQDALEELSHRPANLVVAAWEPGSDMRGWELAAKIKKQSPDTAILVIADYDDVELDEEMRSASPFVYMHRPLDPALFLRLVTAGLDGKDIFEAVMPPASEKLGSVGQQFGPVPTIANDKLDKAKTLVHNLLSDLNAMAILLVTREGKVLIEQGTIGYMNREELASNLVPASVSHLTLREMVGGNASVLQFYDGESYDLFVLSVGLHHALVIVFDGQRGSRELGPVRNFGRRTTEDLIGLLGAEAWLMSAPTPQEEEVSEQRRGRVRTTVVKREEEEPVLLARADIVEEPQNALPEVETPKLQLEAIEGDIDLDLLFGDAPEGGEVDSLFSLDVLEEELSKVEDKSLGGKLDWDKAKELGLLGGE